MEDNMLKWCGQVWVLCMGGKRWCQHLLVRSPEGRKRKRKTLIEVRKGGGKSYETEESNTQSCNKLAKSN